MSSHNSLVATYASHGVAGAIVKELRQAGFDMSKLSVVGRDPPSVAETAGAALVGSLGALDAVQSSCIPPDRVLDYQAELQAGRLLLVAHGTPDEIDQAKAVIDALQPEGWDGKADCAIYYGCVD